MLCGGFHVFWEDYIRIEQDIGESGEHHESIGLGLPNNR